MNFDPTHATQVHVALLVFHRTIELSLRPTNLEICTNVNSLPYGISHTHLERMTVIALNPLHEVRVHQVLMQYKYNIYILHACDMIVTMTARL